MIVSPYILSKLFKTNLIEIKKFCFKQLKNKIKFRYLSQKEKNLVVIKVINKIIHDKQIIASKGRKQEWHDGWNEALRSYSKTKNSKFLIPKFYTARENKIFRLGGEFIKAKTPMFEVRMLNIFRNWYFKKYFSKVKNIYEFGAGTGHNLLELSKIFPDKNIYGSDFVKPAVDLLKLIAKKNKINLKVFQFDMSAPNKNIKILKKSGLFTAGALEQLSGNIYKFINYILSQKPEIVIHIEPVADFYSKRQLVDYLGHSFQAKRKYTNNLLSYLKELEENKKIKIIKSCKSPFGSLMMEGHNLIVWNPFK
jgi:SAM-dependent methyltransferase